jgi:hypothetical protein
VHRDIPVPVFVPTRVPFSCGYQSDTVPRVAMTLRLTDQEQAALRRCAEREGISMQDAARRAVRDYVTRADRRDRVAEAAGRVRDAHAEALDRLGR